MSARFSTSPTLRLPIAESRICARWQRAFAIALLIALILLASRGYPWLAAVTGALVLPLLPALFAQPMVGAVLHWRQGDWRVQQGDAIYTVRLDPRSRTSPLGVYLCWACADGKREGVWLFSDSAPTEQLRRLRVRLALEKRA